MLPETIKPMEPVLVQEPPAKGSYLHSVKWDGVRELLYLDQKGVRIHNRKLRDRTNVYPELHEVKNIALATGLVFDGEVIALNEEGKPDFQRVMRRDSCRAEEVIREIVPVVPIFYMIFDLLYFKGESLMEQPLSARLELLEKILPQPAGPFQIVEHLSDGNQLFERTRELGLEGVVSKDSSSRYMPGTKSRMWVKAKHYKDMTVVAGGFTVKNGFLNSLSVGAYGDDGRFYYLGNVATGLSQSDMEFLDSQLRNSLQAASPFADYKKRTTAQYWLVPFLTLKVKFLEITGDGRLRHPVVIGFVSEDPKDCMLLPEET